MDIKAVMDVVTPILLGLLIAVAIWAVVEIVLTVRSARKTIDDADKVIAKAEPLVEHATLTVDAVNLEVMRVDGILDDVSKVTDSASGAAEAINNVTNAPAKAVTGIVDALRSGTKKWSREHKVREAAKEQHTIAQHAEPQQVAPAVEEAPVREDVPVRETAVSSVTVVTPAVAPEISETQPNTVHIDIIDQPTEGKADASTSQDA